MKFFVYIADAIVDRALAAMPSGEREGLGRELGVDAAVLHRLEVGRSEADEVRFARAEAVGFQLARTGASAPLDARAPFIADRLALHWGRLRVMHGAQLVRHETESPVAFAFSSGPLELMMMGSAKQLLAQPPNATVAAVDDAPDGAAMQLVEVGADVDSLDQRGLAYLLQGASLRAAPAMWGARLSRARADLRALPSQRLEFLAKPVAAVDAGSVRIVLATPVYVAMVV